MNLLFPMFRSLCAVLPVAISLLRFTRGSPRMDLCRVCSQWSLRRLFVTCAGVTVGIPDAGACATVYVPLCTYYWYWKNTFLSSSGFFVRVPCTGRCFTCQWSDERAQVIWRGARTSGWRTPARTAWPFGTAPVDPHCRRPAAAIWPGRWSPAARQC